MKINNRVTVGIVTQPTYDAGGYSTKGTSYVAAGYVKWAGLAGARAVVVPWDADEGKLNYILECTNGLLFPGGPQQDKKPPTPYFQKIKCLYDRVIEINKTRYFPLLGICQGFEQIVLSATDFGPELLIDYFKGTDNVLLPLDFTKYAAKSRMLNSSGIPILNETVRDILSDKENPVTPNFHSNGILYSTFCDTKVLNDSFNVISTNFADEKQQFVSTVEGKIIDGKALPVYGFQWHPSLQIFEFNQTDLSCLTHTKASILAMQYLANFFIDELRKNDNHFQEEELREITFNNLPITYSELIPGGPVFEDAYFFGPPVLKIK